MSAPPPFFKESSIMQLLIIISIILIISFFIYSHFFKTPQKNFQHIILYAADFLEKNPYELTIRLDDVFYSELLDFINKNRSIISQFEQLNSTSINFVIPINNLEYKVYGSKFIADQLVIAAKKLN